MTILWYRIIDGPKNEFYMRLIYKESTSNIGTVNVHKVLWNFLVEIKTEYLLTQICFEAKNIITNDMWTLGKNSLWRHLWDVLICYPF